MLFLRTLATLSLLAAIGCTTTYNRESLQDSEARADLVDGDLKFDAHNLDAYKGEQALKKIGIVSVHSGNWVQKELVTETPKKIRTLTVGLNMGNLVYVADELEKRLIKSLEAQGYTVKPTAEMKKAAAYAKLGEAIDGVKESSAFQSAVASNGNKYNDSLSSLVTDEEWANELAAQTGVDALLVADFGTFWHLYGDDEAEGLKGVKYGLDFRNHLWIVVPHARFKQAKEAAGDSVPWVANNDVITVAPDMDYKSFIFFPTNDDSEKAKAVNAKAWSTFLEEHSLLLELYLEKVKNEMKSA